MVHIGCMVPSTQHQSADGQSYVLSGDESGQRSSWKATYSFLGVGGDQTRAKRWTNIVLTINRQTETRILLIYLEFASSSPCSFVACVLDSSLLDFLSLPPLPLTCHTGGTLTRGEKSNQGSRDEKWGWTIITYRTTLCSNVGRAPGSLLWHDTINVAYKREVLRRGLK